MIIGRGNGKMHIYIMEGLKINPIDDEIGEIHFRWFGQRLYKIGSNIQNREVMRRRGRPLETRREGIKKT